MVRAETTPSITPALADVLRRSCLQSQTPQMAQRLWEQHFTADERRQLGGDLAAAYADGGSFGMWQRLHGVDDRQALVEVGRLIGGLNPATYQWARRELGLSTVGPSTSRPTWDRSTMQLSLGGEIVRRVERPNRASNVLLILDAFQHAGWPIRIDDPLPGGRDSERLHKTIQSLNRKLAHLRFTSDGSGAGIRWQLT